MQKLALMVVVLAACKSESPPGPSSPPRPANGNERGDCIPPTQGTSAGTCAPGLMCLSNLCVRPPPADCQVIADQLASLDLGNYAEPETRAPVVTSYKTACEKALVSKEQGECIAKARDKFSASQCAPLMFPELAVDPSKAQSECATAIAAERVVIAKSMSGANEPQMARMLDMTMKAMRESCEQDGWPPALVACIKAATEVDALSRCNSQIPPEIQTKLSERVTKAAMEVQQQLAPPTRPN
jgi:hypothetical protein